MVTDSCTKDEDTQKRIEKLNIKEKDNKAYLLCNTGR